ncbi:MAG: mechanosensitive ion channel, partial [Candidatus Tritonobacter lacicola]|nr:mechanosensitive ion channel [Candidatus Tritonobacter lacicola]
MSGKITEWLTGEGITVLAVVAAACLLIILAGRLLKKIFRHMEERMTWDDEHERAWKALRQAVSLLVTLGIILAAVVIITNSLGYSFSQVLGQESYTALNKAFKIFLIVALAFIVDRLTRVWIYQAFMRMRGEADLTDSRKKRIDTLGNIVNNAVTIVIGAVAALMVISEIGLDLKAILMGAGVVGVAVGFGAQNLVRDFLGGFFILMEDQYSVGDVISAGGHAGLVQAINLRTTVLRDAEGKV